MKRSDPGAEGAPTFVGAPWGPNWDSEAVIRVLEPLVLEPRKTRILEVLARRLGSVTVLMDAPHDPHNGAAVLRTADAFGIQTVHVVPRQGPLLVASGVAKGTQRWVDVVEHPTPQAAIEALDEYELVAAHPQGELVPSQLADIPKLALVLGNEHDGISAELSLAARRSVCIPMRGFVESLNVSVSAAILLAAATQGRAGDLSEASRRQCYARGLYRSVVRAQDVLNAHKPG